MPKVQAREIDAALDESAPLPLPPQKYLVRGERVVSLPGGLVKFELNAEITDPYLVEVARDNDVPIIPVE